MFSFLPVPPDEGRQDRSRQAQGAERQEPVEQSVVVSVSHKESFLPVAVTRGVGEGRGRRREPGRSLPHEETQKDGGQDNLDRRQIFDPGPGRSLVGSIRYKLDSLPFFDFEDLATGDCEVLPLSIIDRYRVDRQDLAPDGPRRPGANRLESNPVADLDRLGLAIAYRAVDQNVDNVVDLFGGRLAL